MGHFLVPQWFPQTSLYLIFLGLSSHLYMAKGDWDLVIWKYLLAYAALQPLSFGVLLWLGESLLEAAQLVLILNLSYLCPLFLSISLYRVFFHRLRSFPGPFWARLSALWRMGQFARKPGFRVTHALHKKYGDFVRFGPNALSINRASAIAAVHGTGSKCRKSVFYEAGGSYSLQTERDLRKHSARRPAWDRALSSRRSEEYLPGLYYLTTILVSKLSQSSDKPILINTFLQCFVFDMMGEVGFSKTYGSLEQGMLHDAVAKFQRYLSSSTLLLQMPWLLDIMSRSPLPNPIKDFESFAEMSLNERMAAEVPTPDIMSFVLEGKVPLTQSQRVEDTVLLQIAGSDTTLSALIHAIYHLTVHRDVQSTLRSEIDAAVPRGESLQHKHVAKLALLEGVINETLRLHPPVASGLPRETPEEGITIDEFYVPGSTIVSIPTWTVHRDPRNFSDPNVFKPHRWLPDSKEKIHNAKAFIPFSTGPFNCVGQIFAMMEMKVVIARLVTTFEIHFAPGEDGSSLIHEVQDHLTLACPPLWLDLRPRQTT